MKLWSFISERSLLSFIVGCVLFALALYLMGIWEGAEEIQVSASPAEFRDYALEFGNRVKIANLIDMLVFVPGFLIAMLSAVVGLGQYAENRVQFFSIIKKIGIGLSVIWASADETENILTAIAFGGVDFEAQGAADLITPSESIIEALNIATQVKVSFLFAGLAVIFLLALAALWFRLFKNNDG